MDIADKTQYISDFKYEKGVRIIIVETKRNDFPNIGDVGEIISVTTKDNKKEVLVKWKAKDVYVEKPLDMTDMIDAYVKCEKNFEITFVDDEHTQVMCDSCKTITKNPNIVFTCLTRDLVFHSDMMTFEEYLDNPNYYFELYGKERKIKIMEAYAVCSECGEYN